VPAPITGTSPSRPKRLFVMPPVEVAAARLPWTSSATAPTVSRSFSSFSFLSASCHCARRFGVSKYELGTRSTFISSANFSAPSPTMNTWGDFSFTSRARVIGLLTVLSAATEPHERSRPSMMAASSSWVPSWV
jgi:hypothetical protein